MQDKYHKSQLVFLTSMFPFGYGEPFIESELEILSHEFEEIVIIPRINDKSHFRKIPENCRIEYFAAKSNFLDLIKIPCLLCIHMSLLFHMFCYEWKIIKKEYKFTFRMAILKVMFHDLIKGLQCYSFLKKMGNIKDTVYYSYWLNNSSLALCILKNENPSTVCISRAHRHDLYLEQNRFNYLSFQKYKSEKLDKIYFISQQGLSYFFNKTKCERIKLDIAKLGTKSPSCFAHKQDIKEKVLVTCSYMNPVKRISLLIEALSKISTKVKWIHLGDGELRSYCEDCADYYLHDKENVIYEFRGQLSNEEIHQFYMNNWVDLFINVSESEGLPVSLMEAISYGIPIMATNVGGTSEICTETTGCLLPADISASEISATIDNYFNKEYINFDRDCIRAFWSDHFSSEKNYTYFVKQIQSLY